MNRGVTLVELMIAIAIMVLLTSVAVPIYGNFQNNSQVNEVSSVLAQNIRIAQQQAISGVNNANHGVKIFSDRIVLYQGSTYNTRVSGLDRVFSNGNIVQTTDNLLNDEVNFTRGTGLPSATGTITISGQYQTPQIISINKFGIAEISK